MPEAAQKLPVTPAQLRDQVAQLRAWVAQQEKIERDLRAQLEAREEALAKRNRKIELLLERLERLERLELLRHQRFGPRAVGSPRISWPSSTKPS